MSIKAIIFPLAVLFLLTGMDVYVRPHHHSSTHTPPPATLTGTRLGREAQRLYQCYMKGVGSDEDKRKGKAIAEGMSAGGGKGGKLMYY